MVIASLVKEFQLASEINHMKGIVPDDILNALKKKKLGLPGIDLEAVQEKNALMAGEFEVVLELLDAYRENDQAKIAKAQVLFINLLICSAPLKLFLSKQRSHGGEVWYALDFHLSGLGLTPARGDLPKMTPWSAP